jgi:hypothetical protein
VRLQNLRARRLVMFLTRTELVELTGYKKPALQRRWLVENGYRFDVRADGLASVLSSQVAARQGVGREKQVTPNWDALR